MKIHHHYSPDTEYEIELKKQLAELQEHYRREAEPLIKALAEAQAMKPVKAYMIPEEGDEISPYLKELLRDM